MKTLKGVLIFVFLTGMLLGLGQPALLHGSETGGGNVWDQWVDTSPFTGIKLAGTLSIYYEVIGVCCPPPSCSPIDLSPLANMYVTVRLTKGFELYTFQGVKENICYSAKTAQGDWIVDTFLNNAVQSIYPTATRETWRLKSIDNAQFHDQADSRAFVADIQIAVTIK